MSSLGLVVDISKSYFLDMEEKVKSYSKFYVYHFESLASTFREYRSIKMSEFYSMTDKLIKPEPEYPTTPNNSPLFSRMHDFIEKNWENFN